MPKRKSEELNNPGKPKKMTKGKKDVVTTTKSVVTTHMSPSMKNHVSPSQSDKINISPSIAKNPNKFLGAGTHKKNLTQAIESNTPVEPKTPTSRTPKKRLSKFSPFKKSPQKSPRKELFPKSIETQDSDTFLNFYDRTFDKVVLVSVVQMKEWQENKQTMDHLVDLNTLQKFCSLSQSAKNIYVRLVNRKHAWLKKSSLEEKYGKNGTDVIADLYTMEEAGVIESNYEKEDLKTLLELLQVAELKDLCKELKQSFSAKNKSEMIDAIYKFAIQQRNMFGQDTQSHVKKLIQKYLGECVKLASDARDVFLSCVFLVTFPFYHELSDNVTRLNDYISRIVRTVRGEIKFPSYPLNRTCIFKSAASFRQYMEAYELCTNIDMSCKMKTSETVPLLQQVHELLQATLQDQTAMKDIRERPIYLRRYSAGYIYVKTLYSKLNEIKRDHPKLAVEVLTTLLNQTYFKEYDKGKWFEALAQIYQSPHFKDNNKAADTLLYAFKVLEKQRTDKLSEEERLAEASSGSVKKLKDLGWIKHSLMERANMLIARQKGRIDRDKADALTEWIQDIGEPLTLARVVGLGGKLMPNTNKGLKHVYMSQSSDGSRTYSSVEEQASAYFTRLGYTRYRHDEGLTLRSILYALLWDVIYAPPRYSEIWGVFHSPYQESPLDWRTSNFYERRKSKITKRLSEIKEMTPEQVVAEVMKVESEHVDESCVINWSCVSRDNVNILTNCVASITVPLLVNIGEYIIQDVDHNAQGFPDLTMWNPDKKKSIFVEVKSMNDRLSIQQKVWLHKLCEWGANACIAQLKPSAETGEEKQSNVV
uniref:Fanconi-associated nuclease n=1 Tax=Cacopsylla melanoneura TaxID=428564 RepID=A0A8D9BI66_9HEMI